MSEELFRNAWQAVKASRQAGLANVLSRDARHELDMRAYRACEAAGVSIAELRVKQWQQERRWLALALAASFIHPDVDEVPLP